jgi:hypothetical protein
MQNIKSVSVELSNKIDEMINSKVKNETYLLVESLIILEELKELISKEHDQRTQNQLNTMNTTQLTPKELETLKDVAALQIEDNFSEYTSISTNSEKGLIGSLVKKGLVFNGYGGNEGEGYMFYLTEKGFEVCAELNISTSHIIVH